MQIRVLKTFSQLDLNELRNCLKQAWKRLSSKSATEKKHLEVLIVLAAFIFGFSLPFIFNSFEHLPEGIVGQKEVLEESEIYGVEEIPEGNEKVPSEDAIGLLGIDIPNPLDALDSLNPLNAIESFLQSIVDGIADLIMQGVKLFDDFVSFTINIARSDENIVDSKGNVFGIGVNKFYVIVRNIAWLLFPLVIVVNGIYFITEGGIKGAYLAKEVGRKIVLFVIGLVSFRYIASLAIDLINALNQLILQNVIGTASDSTLSEAIFRAMGLAVEDGKLALEGGDIINAFGLIIIWIGLFFLLSTMLFQFIIRFFDLLLHLLLFPIIALISLLPGSTQIFKTYIDEILRNLATQPVFLVGLGLVLEVVSSVSDPVPKLVLALGAISFLNLIPTFVNKFSGILWGVAGATSAGFLSTATIGQAGKVKHGLVAGATGEKSGSLRKWGGSQVGQFLVGKKTGGYNANNTKNSGIQSTKSKGGSTFKSLLSTDENGKKVFKNQPGGNTFGATLKKRTKPDTAFSQLGIKPLSSSSLQPDQKTKSLYKVSPNFSNVSKVSLKDGNHLSASFLQSNFDSYLGNYPMVESKAGVGELTNLSGFNPSNTQTKELMNDSLSFRKQQVNLGNTFDMGKSDHKDHITNWYAKNDSFGKDHKAYDKSLKFANDPKNRMEVIRNASSQGYFKAQGIKTVKVPEHVKGQKPVNKYYKVSNISKSNVRNRTAKTK